MTALPPETTTPSPPAGTSAPDGVHAATGTYATSVPDAPRGAAVPSTRREAVPRSGGPVRCAGPVVTELRLSAFASHRGATFPIGPVTLFAGPGGSGKSTVLRAYEALARLGSGDPLEEVFPDPEGCVPEGAAADAQGRRGFRIGCTTDGPAGPVRLDVAVQAEPTLRIVGERLTGGGETLLTTALRDPGRSSVQAAWYTAGAVPVTRAPLPDDRLGTALLPLRVAGTTEGQLRVLAAAEQVVVALRSVFACEPQPSRMRAPVPMGDGLLRRGCDNLAAVLERTYTQCGQRHARLVAAAQAGCAGPVTELGVERSTDGLLRAVVGRGGGRFSPVGRLGDGELRYLALALVLLTGPGVLAMDAAGEVPSAMQTLTVLADGLDRDLDGRQLRELVDLAVAIGAAGHLRLVGTVTESGAVRARETPGVTVVDLES
ncbi:MULTISPECIES: AAA family ATPase [unclassified Streptomyces]|uniref:AAA family ATPase n=1 Tax=unclassified Streptomyces TaxID=2593676 RepID=UPI0022562ED3|nr:MULTISPECIES: ATP-binding protein [unclassified Streptomyces]WSP58230.1 ATP-binding protein [Streptomyces sp. NBC_01241]WSU21192.1 ATP-binding protein [Streptomyces sp. NBC_01108]MCX4794291.1 ATP-binding protein [Streptomyces sp. NBC_01242]WSJ35681.1 ATP-binding protein [Streptomyces sp. NBC_01321]WSP62109.1 ATP-binding protein [Streptomyces sp. NBC_01240]